MNRIAVVGAGRIGRIHARNIAQHPRLALAGIVDPSAPAVAAIIGECGGSAATFAEVVADPAITGVIIASPTDLHLDQALALAASGKAILCEKPVDLDLARAKAAAPVLSDARVRMLIGFNRRFDPDFQALKSRLIDGSLGDLETLHIVSHDPAPPPIAYIATSGGLFRDMAIHDFDTARWLLDDPIVEVYAATACHVDPAIAQAGDCDTAKTILRTARGRLCVISNSRRSGYGYDQRIEAFCSNGLVRADNRLESTVSTWSAPGMASDALQNFFLDRYAAAYRAEIDHFAMVLAGEQAPSVTFADGLAALELAEAAALSARSGQPVKL
jgi:myo-inositol 2-dehydrogenase/D-chiro-inositol 1-dehydrogenase